MNDCGLDGIHLLNKSVPRPLSARGKKLRTQIFSEKGQSCLPTRRFLSRAWVPLESTKPNGFSAQRASPKSAQGRVRGTYDPPKWFARVAWFVSPNSQTIARRERRPGKGRKPKPIRPKGATLNESSLEVKRRIAKKRIADPDICRNYIQSLPTWLASRRCGFFVVRTTSPNLKSSVGQVLKAVRQSLLQTRLQVGRSVFILGTESPDLRA